MTNKIEISRELAETLVYLHETDQYMDIDIARLRNLLANHSAEPLGVEPVVERQPVAEVQHGPFDDVGAPQWVRVATLGDFDLENFPDGTKLYTAPPELAELKAAIAELTTENEQNANTISAIDKHLRGCVNDPDPLPSIMPGAFHIETTYGLVAGIRRERDQIKAEIERLKGGQREAVAMVLPDRKTGNDYFQSMTHSWHDAELLANEYNSALDDVRACLDKVKELTNGR